MIQMLFRRSIGLAGLFLIGLSVRAAVPSPEQLLPADTLVVFSIPDWTKLTAYFDVTPQGQLWQDSSVKPFRDNFVKRFNEDVITPLEKELGIKMADYSGLAQGQVTLAVTQNGWDGKSEKKPGILLLIDSKEKGDQLKKQLGDLKQKWIDSGKQIKSEKVRDIEFTTLIIQESDLNRTLEKVFPSRERDDDSDTTPDNKAKDGSIELTVGQSGPLLIIGNTLSDIEKVVSRQTGGSVPSLGEQAIYESSQASFRDALGFGWVNFKPVLDVLAGQFLGGGEMAESPLAPKPDKILAATGLSALKTVSFKLNGSPDGSLIEVFLSIPESGRQGLFKIFSAEAKESAPPPFVPAEITKFTRWRIDGQRAWTTIESILTSISPEMAGVLQMGLSMVGKDKDPNFDLKKSLVGNLGDDFISFEKAPKTSSLKDLDSPPTLFLIGSPNPEKLAQAFRAATSLLPTSESDAPLRERELLGRKVYSVTMPSNPEAGAGRATRQSLNFAATGGYVALTGDVGLLEEHLRSSESSGKSLRETVGLGEAAQKIGGMGTGLFGYEDQHATMRATFEALKNDSGALQRLLSMSSSKFGVNEESKDWFDFTLLPPFDRVSKYFSYIVYSGSVNSSGLSWKLFAPTPPQVKK